MTEFIFPDYDGNNILNISATFAEHFGQPNRNKTIPELKKFLQESQGSIVFFICDGMGSYPLSKVEGEDGYFRSHTVKTLTSVFPSTTACASATLMTNRYPSEHGRYGWCMFLPTMGGRVDILTGQSSTDTTVCFSQEEMFRVLPLYPYYNRVTEYEVHRICPTFINDGMPDIISVSSVKETFSALRSFFPSEKKKFVYVHCPEPDWKLHDFGIDSEQAKEVIAELEREMQSFVNDFPDVSTVVTADHGQTEVSGYLHLYRDEYLLSLLDAPLYTEVRAVSLAVRTGKEQEVVSYIEKAYPNLTLLSVRELAERGVFGPITESIDRLGTFLLVPKDGKTEILMHAGTNVYLAHHTAPCEEMLVPLILLRKEE